MATQFVQEAAEAAGRPIAITPDALEYLSTRDWSESEVSQLRNTIRNAAIRARNEIVTQHIQIAIDSLSLSAVCRSAEPPATPEEQLEGWLGEIDLSKLERLCTDIWTTEGGCIANDPVRIVDDHGLNPFYTRAAVAAFWTILNKTDNVKMFERIFGIREDRTTNHRSLLTKLSRKYPRAFPRSPGLQYHGVPFLEADGDDLVRAGFDLQLA
ncbi:hypothetical protein KJ567_07150 [Candidatus Bipolaricaulota bacterium]|nr:hypothetical protein [Candidatus Bipolaricaulota bacterium]